MSFTHRGTSPPRFTESVFRVLLHPFRPRSSPLPALYLPLPHLVFSSHLVVLVNSCTRMFNSLTTSAAAVLSLVVLAQAQDFTSNSTSLTGTWSTGSGAVTTGPVSVYLSPSLSCTLGALDWSMSSDGSTGQHSTAQLASRPSLVRDERGFDCT